MVDSSKRPKLVGNFIRQRRDSLNLSQRALGLLFDPPVTTQFISNLERGVTPLPPIHVTTLAKALSVSEDELTQLLAIEYSLKLSGRLGKLPAAAPDGTSLAPTPASTSLAISSGDYDFIKNIYNAYRQADPKTKQAFATVCESILGLAGLKQSVSD